MTARTTTRLAWALWIISVGTLLTSTIALHVVPLSNAQKGSGADGVVAFALIGGFATVGSLLAWKQPANPIGWLLSLTGLSYAAAMVNVVLQGFRATEGISNWFGWIWLFGLGFIAFVLLLFPTGSVVSPRWRIAGWVEASGLAAWLVGNALAPTIVTSDQHLPNPIGVPAPIGNVFSLMVGIGGVCIVGAGLAAIVSLFARFRRGGSVEREQLKWLLYAGILIAAGVVAQVVVTNVMGSTQASTNLANAITTGTVAFVPGAIGIAIFRYRLYDIDVVINRTVVYVALAAFITGIYVAIVVGVGSLIGRTDRPNVALSIVATAVVAVAFQPVRARVQRVANRLVYGERATPYEALSQFADQMGTTDATEDVLPRVARVLAEATGATRTEVWLRSGASLRLETSFPSDSVADSEAKRPGSIVELSGGTLPALPGTTATFEVRHQGNLLGALALTKRAGEGLTPTESTLASQLASQAGLALRNAGLTDELKARLVELRESRQRVVATADEERRRLERNIHDGAQQQLVALAVKVKLAEGLIARDASRAKTLVEQVRGEAGDALENLRDLARGIYPPLLTDQGIAAALEAQVRTSPIPITVEAQGLGRHAQESEAAVYFSALEALQNVAKYADATAATVRLTEGDGHLVFEVTDDGRGFDPEATGYGTGLQGIADRLGAVDGDIDVRSAPGRGTTVMGRVPLRELESVT
jgi:signal transduction histidine kinase